MAPANVLAETYFYPRPPRGGRLVVQQRAVALKAFLSTPSARRATWGGNSLPTFFKFLSTPSARRATEDIMASTTYAQFLSTPSARRATRTI